LRLIHTARKIQNATAAAHLGPNRTAIQLKIDQLGAVYASLGQVTADTKAVASEVKSLKEAVETESHSGWVQKHLLGPKEIELATGTAAKDRHTEDIERMRDQFAEETMPAAKEGERRYNAAFAEQVSMPGGAPALARIVALACDMLTQLPPAPSWGAKAARQPNQSIEELQREGVHEASLMFAVVMGTLKAEGMVGADLDGSSVCLVEKTAARAFEKVYGRWGGDFRSVTDWGRATVCGCTLEVLSRAVDLSTKALAGLGYVVVAVKNSLDMSKDVAANGGYRNLLVNLQCPGSKHIVELQFTLSNIESVKHSEYGHVVFELLRQCGFSVQNSVVKGGWTNSMFAAIRSGRAVELNCEEACWTVEDAAKLKTALSLSGCRVSKINCSYSVGDGVSAMSTAVCECSTVTSIK
jgi:hypothetical protein